jgi:hypothetical protein
MVFFTNGGAEATENAVRMARLHTGRHKVLNHYRSYHGATAAPITLTGDPRRWPSEPGMPGVVKFWGPYPYRSAFHSDQRGEETERALQHLDDVLMVEGAATVAAIILETVVGTNGILVPPPGYLAGVRERCDRHGIVMICDEVMAGFGRCGEWFAFQHWGVSPTSCASPRASTPATCRSAASSSAAGHRRHVPRRVYPGGLTYSGHPLACASAVASINIFEEEGIVEHARCWAPTSSARAWPSSGQPPQRRRRARPRRVLGDRAGEATAPPASRSCRTTPAGADAKPMLDLAAACKAKACGRSPTSTARARRAALQHLVEEGPPCSTTCSGHSRAHDAPARAPHVWVGQLVELGVVNPERTAVIGGRGDHLAAWARAERLHPEDALSGAVQVLAQVRMLPRLPTVVTPPSKWGATNRGIERTQRSSDQIDAKALKLIRALLAKAEGTTFDAEAEAFTAKAQELMTRHSIDAAVLASSVEGSRHASGVESRRVHIDNPYAEEKAGFLAAIGEVNGVKCVWVPYAGLCTAMGFPVDLQLTDLLFTSLLVQATRASAAATAGNRQLSTASFRRAFLVAFADRIAERLEAARSHTRAEAAQEYGDSLLPVLASREAAVEAAYAEAFPNATTMRSRSLNAAGWYAGRAAADAADIGAGGALPAG